MAGKDPYARIYRMMTSAGGSGVTMRIGEVTSKSPLQASVSGIEADVAYKAAGLDVSKGDAVLLLTEDDQTFWAICKVVSAT